MRLIISAARVLSLMATLWPMPGGAKDFISVNSGDWFSPTVWAPTPYPFNGDNATISSNTVSLTLYNDLVLQVNDFNLFNGTLSVNNWAGAPDSLTMTGADSYWTNGTVSVGTEHPVTVAQTGTLRLMGNNTANFGNSFFLNQGTIRQIGTGALRVAGGAMVNSVGGVYEFAGDGGVSGGFGGGAFTNAGTLLKSSGVNTSTIGAWFRDLGGVIEVDSGTLAIQLPNANPSFVSSNGTFIVGAGATLDLTGGGNALWSGQITGSGAGHVVLRGGSLNDSGSSPVPILVLDFPDGMFQWIGGDVGGIITNLGVMTLAGTGTEYYSGVMVNEGLFRHTNTATLGPGRFENLAGGTYDVEGNGGFSAGQFENFGLFRKSAGTGLFTMTFGNFYNYGGTVEIDNGGLNFNGTVFSQTNGATRLAGGTLSGNNMLNFSGGILTGAGSVTGNVVNAAAVAIPGNGGLGTLQITGNYQQNSGGALDIALGGTNAGQFGQLRVSGLASLAGALNLFATNHFTPAIGDQFLILSYSSVSGTFSLPPTFPAGMAIAYNSNGVFLTVTGAVIWPAQLNPPVLENGNINFSFQTVSGQSYVVQTNGDLTEPNWGDFSNVTGDGSAVQFAVPLTNVPSRFFRLREP